MGNEPPVKFSRPTNLRSFVFPVVLLCDGLDVLRKFLYCLWGSRGSRNAVEEMLASKHLIHQALEEESYIGFRN